MKKTIENEGSDMALNLDELDQVAGGKGEEIGPGESPVNNQVINGNGDYITVQH